MSVLAGLAAGAVAAGANYLSENYFTNKQVKNQTKLMQIGQQMALDNERLAPAARAEGLKAAGINPAVMAGQSFTPASQPSGSAAKGDGRIADASLASALLDVELKKAEVKNIEADTTAKTITNTREATADTDYNAAVIQRLKETKSMYDAYGVDSSEIKNNIDRLIANPTNLGNFTANMKAIEATTQSVEGFTARLKSLVEMAVADRQLQKSSGAVEAIANMPEAQYNLAVNKAAAELEQSYYLAQGTKESEQRVLNLQKEIKKMTAEITQLEKQGELTEAQANQIRNNDVSTLIINGELGKAAIAEGVTGGNAFVHGLGQGAGFGAAAALTGGKAAIGAAPVAARGAVASATRGAATKATTPLSSVGKAYNSGSSPFKFGTPSHNVYKALEARWGVEQARSYYADYLKDKTRGKKSFNAWWYDTYTRGNRFPK